MTQPQSTGTVANLPAQRQSLVAKFAHKYTIEPERLLPILKATAFKVKDGEATNEQLAALLVVADQYGLNPFTREIFAFPDKQNGIVPVVGVDGWSRIINDHPQSDGFHFSQSDKLVTLPDAQPCPEWMEVMIFRKDRSHPIIVREYLDEVYRPLGKYQDGNKHKPGPWQTHTKRFLRHKTLIQGARLAYGFSGIYDEDEAARIVDGAVIEHQAQPASQPQQRGNAGLRNALQATADADADTTIPPQKDKPVGAVETRDEIVASYGRCSDTEALDLVADESREFAWTEADQAVLTEAYKKRRGELGG